MNLADSLKQKPTGRVIKRSTRRRGECSFAQEGMFFLQELKADHAYIVPTIFRFIGPLDVSKLKLSVKLLARRHEVLRTRYVISEAGVICAEVSDDTELELIYEPNPAVTLVSSVLEGDVASVYNSPWDLRVNSPIRANLLRLSDTDHVLIMSTHHIATDGRSEELMMRDLSRFYNTHDLVEDLSLSALPTVRYLDYAQWQRDHEARGGFEKGLKYWTDHLAGLRVLSLPHPGLPEQSRSKAGAVEIEFGDDICDHLELTAKLTGVSVLAVAASALMVCLSRWSQTTDVAIGTPVSGRTEAELDDVLGMFVNTVVLRSETDYSTPFATLVADVGARLIRALDNLDVPFNKIVDQLSPSDRGRDNPLFNVMYTYEDAREQNQVKFDGLVATQIAPRTSAPKFDLSIDLVRRDANCLTGTVTFDEGLFGRSAIRRLANFFGNAMRALCESPLAPMKTVELLPTTDREWLLEHAAFATREAVSRQSLYQRVVEVCTMRGDAVAVVSDGTVLTYSDLIAKSDGLARLLYNSGVRDQDRVAICLPRDLGTVVPVILAVHRLGGTYVPVDPDYPEARLAAMLTDCRPALVVCSESSRSKIPEHYTSVLADQETSTDDFSLPEARRHSAAPAYLMYTSGSTGMPKGVVVSHQSIFNLVDQPMIPSITAGDVIGQTSSISFDAFTFECWSALLNGATLVQIPKTTFLDAPELSDFIRDTGVTVMFLTSALFNQLAIDDSIDFSPLRLLIYGGEGVDRGPADRLSSSARGPEILVNGYGPTETTTFATYHAVKRGGFGAGAMPLGVPLSGVGLVIADTSYQLTPRDAEGELYISGIGVADGYWNRPDLNVDKFLNLDFGNGVERYYRTGDICRWNEEGALLYSGRVDDQVKIRGFRVEKGEISSILSSHPSVKSVVVDIEEDGVSRRVVAYFSPYQESEIDSEDLLQWCADSLPHHMVPQRVFSVRSIPLTANGKTDFSRLRRERGDVREKDDRASEESPLIRELLGLWREALGLDELSTEDDFFAVGGNSLQIAKGVRLTRQAGFTLAMEDAFEHRTVRDLSRQVASDDVVDDHIVRLAAESSVLSYAQERMLFLNDLSEQLSSAYVVPTALRLHGVLKLDALRESLRLLVERHPILRTRYVTSRSGDLRTVVDANPEVVLRSTRLPVGVADQDEWINQSISTIMTRGWNLQRAAPIRLDLIKVSPTVNILLICVHHIATDARTEEILVSDIFAFYRSKVHNESPMVLRSLPIRYSDYASWQRDRVESGTLHADVEYWAGQLANLELLSLPETVHPAPKTGSAHSIGFTLPVSVVIGLTKTARTSATTMFTVTVAAFMIALGELSGSSDVALGTPVSGRVREELEDLAGLFVNTLVLRGQIYKGDTYLDVVARVRKVVLEALAHQELPFEKVVAVAAPSSRGLVNPLFNVLYTFRESHAPDNIELPGLSAGKLEVQAADPKVAISLDVLLTAEGGLSGSIVYDSGLFTAASMARLCGLVSRTFEELAEFPSRRLEDHSFIPQVEIEWLQKQADYDHTRWDQDDCLFSRFETVANRLSDNTAVVDGDLKLTYGEVSQLSRRVASCLTSLGVVPGDRVAICLSRSMYSVIPALLAVIRLGAVYVPIDPSYPSKRILTMLDDSQATAVICSRANAEALPSPDLHCVIDDLPESADVAYDALVHYASDAAYLMYTSGSTGQPKGVTVSQKSILNLIDQGEYFAITELDVVAQTCNTSFDVFTYECWGALLAGATLVTVKNSVFLDAPLLSAFILNNKVTVMFLTSALFNHLALDVMMDFSPLRVLVYGGEGVDRVPADKLMLSTRKPQLLLNGYGPTEATTFATFFKVLPGGSGSGSMPIGKPLAGVGAAIVNKTGSPLPRGAVGELVLSGVGLGLGYHNRPRLNRERFVSLEIGSFEERFYRTGDLARWDDDGNLRYCGRDDSQVKLRGFRIELSEVASEIGQCPGVRSAVVAVDGTAPNQRLVAYVAADPGSLISSDRLRHWCADRLPAHMVPDKFVKVSHIPLTGNGKTDVPALQLLAPERKVAADPVGGSGLLAVWQDALNIPGLSLTDDFFEIGADSLGIARGVRMSRAHGFSVSLADAVGIRTVAGLLERITLASRDELHTASDGQGKLLVDFRAGCDASILNTFFIHPGGGSVHWYSQIADAMPVDVGVWGIQASGLDDDTAPLSSIREMALRYWEEVSVACQHGPVVLVGWSLGGLIAQEMARLNPSRCKQLILLEPPVVDRHVVKRMMRSVDAYAKAYEIHAQAVKGGSLHELRIELHALSGDLEFPQNELEPLTPWPYLAMGGLYRAAVQHIPRPLAGDSGFTSILVVSDDVGNSDGRSTLYAERGGADYVAYWTKLLPKDTRIVRLAGSHYDLVMRPLDVAALIHCQ